MNVILIFLFGTLFIVSPVVSHGWEFGEFVAGDTFEYDICDDYTLDPNTALRSKCYTITLHVVDGFEMDFGDVWLMYVTSNDGMTIIHDMIIVDESFHVNSLNHKYIGDSIENTLFWMPLHAGVTDISLELGNVMYSNSGYDMTVTDFSRELESMQSTDPKTDHLDNI